MEYKDALETVVELIRSGTLTIGDVDKYLNDHILIPIDIVEKFHMLFCTKHRIAEGGKCLFYLEKNRTDQPTFDRWTGIVRSYMDTFKVSIDTVRAEIDELFLALRNSKYDSRLNTLYYTFHLLDDPVLAEYITCFVQNLNTDDKLAQTGSVDYVINCQCERKPGEFIPVDNPSDPRCKVCGLPILLTN